ncbi:MAG: hypothetical protein KC423_22070 [Anaerolineales bacterium]|nr:hypothetical protein [Anaerolineales bacterium]MCA9966959.1 hypothetical protein [Anaerolineales bacterium]
MAPLIDKSKAKKAISRTGLRLMALLLFLTLFATVVLAIDGTPAGAFIAFLIALIFFSTVLADWRERRQK